MSSWYLIILFVHILAGITWVGAGITLHGSIEREIRKEGVIEADRMLQQFEWTGNWIFIPAPLLVVATGITMVVMAQGIGFGDTWVIVALSLFVLSLILAGGVGGVYQKRLAAHREAGTVGSAEHDRLFRAFLRIDAIEMTAVLVIVSMMVFKPV